MPEYHWVNDDIFTVTEFFTPEECQEWIEFAESIGFSDAPITTGSGPVMRPDIRNNQRVVVDDTPRAGELFRRAEDYLPKVQAELRLACHYGLRVSRQDAKSQAILPLCRIKKAAHCPDNGELNLPRSIARMNMTLLRAMGVESVTA